MNNQEALELLKTHNEKCSGCDKLCDDMCKPAVELAIKALEEIQQYRSIGTVEECRDAIEKQIPKEWGDFAEILEVITCPVCLTEWNVIDNDTERFNYCPKCGQRLED